MTRTSVRLKRMLQGVCVAAILIPAIAATGQLTPTTTLAREKGNNTSANSSFAASVNANAAAANVSKVPIRSLLYPGATTRIYANWLGWFGPSNHINVGYHSDDAAQVHRQVEDMISRGIQGVVVDWFGPTEPTIEPATQLMKAEAEAHPGFEFSIMEDVGAVGAAARQNGCDVTTQIINDLKYVMQNYATSPAYSRFDGRPLITFFGVSAYYVDWDKVRASVPGGPLFIFRGIFGFQHAVSDGAFQWIDLNSKDPFDPELAAQDAFYSQATNTSAMSIGSAYKGFHDGVAAWSDNRFVHQRCGQTWLATFAEVAKFYSSATQLRSIQLVTWNDYEEGTEIETGVDNCVVVSPAISGSTLTWTISGGAENTIHHYTVFASTDGQNLAKLTDVAPGVHFLALSRFVLPQANYTIYVKAVGKATIQNKMSPGIVYRPGDQPPSFSFAVTRTGAATVRATISGATDANGIGATRIDFGDGNVVSGPTATHTYGRHDSYTVTATVFDGLGASSVASRTITVKPSTTGVSIFGPGDGTTVNSPVTFSATASSDAQITAMRVYVDGSPVYTIDRDFIRTALKLYKGTHNVIVQAWNAKGAVFKSAVSLSAEPNDKPPVARVTVKTLPGMSPTTVLACSATSSDPDGFISGRMMQFSDGTLVSGPSAVHTFASPGSYSVNLAVTDQFGAGATTTLPFTVPLSGGGGSGGSGVAVASPTNGATISSPVHFAASATSPNAPITAMAIYIDYKLALLVSGASIDKDVAVANGTHGVIVQAWDATGAVFKTPLSINVSGTAQGVAVSSPTNGATVTSPVRFVASATSPNAPITAIAVYVDYQRVALVNAGQLDQSVALASGLHQVMVQAWDATGAVFKAPLTITVGTSAAMMQPVSTSP